MIKAKLKAAAIHGSITAVTGVITASIVYFVWYPGELAEMLSGTALFLIMLGVELCLGPLMSLVIYNTRKPRVELVRDYTIVGLIQVAALAYGLYSVAISRPVLLVFVKDRIEVVSATELKAGDFVESKGAQYASLSWFGPRSICTESPTDPQEKSDLLISALGGKDIQLTPKYYRECHPQEVINKAFAKQKLLSATSVKLEELPKSLQSVDFKWLPVASRFGFGIVVYQNKSVESPTYIDLDPYLTR